MYLVPEPKFMTEYGTEFVLDYATYIVLSEACTPRICRQAQLLRDGIEKNTGYRLHLTRGKARKGDLFLGYLEEPKAEEAYELRIAEDGIRILGTERSVIWGIQTFLQILEQTGACLPALLIQDAPELPYRGFYHDVTRGRVPKLETLKALADMLSRYKMNQLQLYVEHTYLFRDFSEVWRDDTPLTPEDILELDAYCADRGVELIPSISTCSHLYKVLRTQSFQDLCELEEPGREPHSARARMLHHTVNIQNPAAMQLVKNMIDEYRSLFSTDWFNICADETFDLGSAKSRAYCEEKGHGQAYVEYVRELCRYVIEKGGRPMMWGDIIVQYPELLQELPGEVLFLNWGYEADITDETTKCFAKAGVSFCNCPGVSGWSRFLNDNNTAYENIRRMASYVKNAEHLAEEEPGYAEDADGTNDPAGAGNGGRKCGLGLVNTDWGDYYHVSSPEFSYIGLMYGAQMAWGRELGQDELNRAASVLEFGDRSGRLAGTLCRIYENCLYSWMDFCIVKENREQKDVLERVLEKGFSSPEKAGRFTAAQEELLEIRRLLSSEMADVSGEQKVRRLLGDYILAADGCRLFNRLGMVIACRECQGGQADRSEAWGLAGELETWFMYYKESYRRTSRESELRFVQDIISWYCDYLRQKSVKKGSKDA